MFLLCALFNISIFAEEEKEEKAKDLEFILKPLTYVNVLTDPIKDRLKENNIDLNFFLGILQGYDNNVNLNPDRKKDGFLETSLNTEFVYNYTDDIRLFVENDTMSTIYYNINNANLVDIYDRAGFEVDIFEDIVTLGSDYALEIVLFPGDKDGNYISNEVKAFLKHKILDNAYHKIGYFLLYKNYLHDKVLGSNEIETSELRGDDRNGIEYEIGLHPFKKLILKTNLELYRNNSNYQYFDYYDYWLFKARPSCIFMITDKLYTSGSFTYQQRLYDDRLSSDDDEHVYDDTYSFNVSLLYDLTRSFTVALSYSYRENDSNEPMQGTPAVS